MPYINNNGIKIHYEVIGQGEPLVMHHWGGGCTKDWHDLGYVDILKKHKQLILIDARGCGKSDKPHEPQSYALELKVTDTIAVMDHLNIKQADCFGYSMGGRTLFGLMKFYPERFTKFIIGGAHPYSSTGLMKSLLALLPEGMAHVIERSEKVFGPYPKKLRENYLKNDPLVLIAAYTLPWNDLSDCLNNINVPCLLYVGSKDPLLSQMKQCSELIKNCKFHILDKLDHAQVYWQSKILAPSIVDFLKS